jgi:hypothetical protein
MKKIRYTIQRNTVWKELYDTKLDLVINFTGLYKGENKKDCEEWLSNYIDELEIKKELKKVKGV